MVNETSIAAWHKKLEHVDGDERAVLEVLMRGPATIREIKEALGWEAGRVSARLNALQSGMPGEEGKRKLGLIESAEMTRDPNTRRIVHRWRLKAPIELPPPFASQKEKIEDINKQSLFQ